MNKPKLPVNPARDTKPQRQRRLDYLFYLVEDGYPVCSATKMAGVSTRCFYKWLNGDADLMAQYEDVQLTLHAKVGELAKLCALKALDDHRYQTSMIFYLKCRANWNDGTGFTTGTQEMPSIQFKKSRKVVKKVTG